MLERSVLEQNDVRAALDCALEAPTIRGFEEAYYGITDASFSRNGVGPPGT